MFMPPHHHLLSVTEVTDAGVGRQEGWRRSDCHGQSVPTPSSFSSHLKILLEVTCTPNRHSSDTAYSVLRSVKLNLS